MQEERHGPPQRREEERFERCGCRGRKRRRRPLEEANLIELLHRCGHYLHHGRGESHSQDRILWILADRREMSQSELTQKLQIQPGSMSEILTKLENGGYLTRSRDEEDRRRVILRITPEGSARAGQRKMENEQELFHMLSEEERAVLRGLLIRILRVWEGQQDAADPEGRSGGSDRSS